MHALQFTLAYLTHAEQLILQVKSNKKQLTENKQNSTSTITRDTCIY